MSPHLPAKLDSQDSEKVKEHSGSHGFMDGLREKLHGTKLHEAKVALHHKKFVSFPSHQDVVTRIISLIRDF